MFSKTAIRTLGIGLAVGVFASLVACAPSDDANVAADGATDPTACELKGCETSSSGGIFRPPPPPPDGNGEIDDHLSHCASVEIYKAVGNEKPLTNTRVTPVVNGYVPCVPVDGSTDVRSCKFVGKQAYVLAKQGAFVQEGQAIGLDGSDDGEYVVAAPVTVTRTRQKDGRTLVYHSVPCTAAFGQDTVGTAAGSELAAACTRETLNLATNWNASVQNDNVATLPVCGLKDSNLDVQASVADGTAKFEGEKAMGTVQCYSGAGAGLNDLNGTERDRNGIYMPGSERCHVIYNGSYETPGSKRPATGGGYPVKLNEKTGIAWRPVASIPVAN